MPGLSLKDQTDRAQSIWDRYYKKGESVRVIATELGLTTQAVYAFMKRRDWPVKDEKWDGSIPSRPVT